MNTKTATIYLVATYDKWDKESRVFISDSEFGHSEGYTVIGSQEVTFEVPDIEIIDKAVIAGLHDIQREMRATAAAAITEVDNQIATMISLEHLS